jgi:hypothetical protein
VPANVVAIVMDSPKEVLSCKAFSADFMQNGEAVSRGVISFYAALTISKAANVRDWLRLIDEQAEADVQQKKLSPNRQPKLKIIGNASMPLP